MLEGSLTIVGYGEDSLQSHSHSKLEDSLYSRSSMGKSHYTASLTPNWKTHSIAGLLWGSLNIGEVSQYYTFLANII